MIFNTTSPSQQVEQDYLDDSATNSNDLGEKLIIESLFNIEGISDILNSIVAQNEMKEKLYKSPNIVSKLKKFTEVSLSYNQFSSIFSGFNTPNNEGVENNEDGTGDDNFNVLKEIKFSKEFESIKEEMLVGMNKLKGIVTDGTLNEFFNDEDIHYESQFSEQDEKAFNISEKFPNIISVIKELKRIQMCFRGYEDTQFEDGIEWFSCFFLCKLMCFYHSFMKMI